MGKKTRVVWIIYIFLVELEGHSYIYEVESISEEQTTDTSADLEI